MPLDWVFRKVTLSSATMIFHVGYQRKRVLSLKLLNKCHLNHINRVLGHCRDMRRCQSYINRAAQIKGNIEILWKYNDMELVELYNSLTYIFFFYGWTNRRRKLKQLKQHILETTYWKLKKKITYWLGKNNKMNYLQLIDWLVRSFNSFVHK